MKKIFSTLFIFFSVLTLFSQNQIDNLNNQKKEILRQITENSQQLDEINKSKKNTINQITLKNKSIQLQNSLLQNINKQINLLNFNLIKTTQEIDSLSTLIELRQSELVKIYRSYYKKLKKTNNILILLLSSDSFNQAFTRLKMYKSLINYFNLQLKLLRENKSELEQMRENYVLFLKELKVKEIEYQRNLNKLNISKLELELTKKQLEKKKSDLQIEINHQRKQLALIDNEIKRLIEENRKAIKSMNKESSRRYAELSIIFKENKGKFPPPASNSSILNPFGEYQHPILKNVKIKNNGIDLILSKNGNVTSIYKGEIKKIFNVPYGGKAIIIRHGEYLSVYSNMRNVNVKLGQNVNTGEILGDVIKQPDNTYILHFEIWNEKEPENPMNWITF